MLVELRKNFFMTGGIEEIELLGFSKYEVLYDDYEITKHYNLKAEIDFDEAMTKLQASCYVDLPDDEILAEQLKNDLSQADRIMIEQVIDFIEDYGRDCPEVFAKPLDEWRKQFYGK